MDSVFTWSLYGVAAILLGVSRVRDKDKTKQALKKTWTMFVNVLPQFVAILLLVGLLLAVVTPGTIQRVLGRESGLSGMLVAILLGSAALVPVLIAFPIASELLASGAGIPQIAVFISTLTMVGFVTLPMEAKYLGKKAAVLRNALAFLFSFLTAAILGAVLS